jgi:class 3 adenylate cyclase
MHAKTAESLVDQAVTICMPGCDAAINGHYLSVLLSAPGLARLRRKDVILAGIAASRAVIQVWEQIYPDSAGPPLAVEAAEAWMKSPSDASAEAAATAAKLAGDQALAVWRRPERAAAWVGRTAAWAASAPKYGWQAVPAIYGAVQVAGKPLIVSAVHSAFGAMP